MNGGDNHREGPDLFTRLCIKCIDTDQGLRPINALGWLSPSITFVPDPPLLVGQPAKIRITVHNFGTMDATGALLEVTYNVWIGNQAEGMQPITNMTLPSIPNDGQGHVFEVDWTPPNVDSTHACVHARVFDAFSLQNNTSFVFLWDSLLNPQAGNKNLDLVPIRNRQAPIILNFKAKNFGPEPIRARVLMTNITDRARIEGGDRAMFPLPFRLERLPPHVLRGPQVEPRLPPREALRPSVRDVAGLDTNTGLDVHRGPSSVGTMQPDLTRSRAFGTTLRPAFGGQKTGIWPSDEVDPALMHKRFGFVDADPRRVAEVRQAPRNSLVDLALGAGSERTLPFVIPPEEFPPRGRRKAFQIYYQTDHGLPVMRHIFLYH